MRVNMKQYENKKRDARRTPRRKDTAPLPQEGFVREAGVLGHIPFGHSKLWEMVRAGKFPAPVKLSERVTAWRVGDVRAWIAAAYQAGAGKGGIAHAG
jgi:predicted DNA-binding transcriptional regulator AlpA